MRDDRNFCFCFDGILKVSKLARRFFLLPLLVNWSFDVVDIFKLLFCGVDNVPFSTLTSLERSSDEMSPSCSDVLWRSSSVGSSSRFGNMKLSASTVSFDNSDSRTRLNLTISPVTGSLIPFSSVSNSLLVFKSAERLVFALALFVVRAALFVSVSMTL